ncbi:hypothetical protein LguiB_011616 [Lonicera macranthoides]
MTRVRVGLATAIVLIELMVVWAILTTLDSQNLSSELLLSSLRIDSTSFTSAIKLVFYWLSLVEARLSSPLECPSHDQSRFSGFLKFSLLGGE